MNKDIVINGTVVTQSWKNFWKPLLRFLKAFGEWTLIFTCLIVGIATLLVWFAVALFLGILWLLSLGHLVIINLWVSWGNGLLKDFMGSKTANRISKRLEA